MDTRSGNHERWTQPGHDRHCRPCGSQTRRARRQGSRTAGRPGLPVRGVNTPALEERREAHAPCTNPLDRFVPRFTNEVSASCVRDRILSADCKIVGFCGSVYVSSHGRRTLQDHHAHAALGQSSALPLQEKERREERKNMGKGGSAGASCSR
jgi:hypothetical protein